MDMRKKTLKVRELWNRLLRGCEVPSGDIQNPLGHLPLQPAVGNCFSSGLDEVISRNLFQSLQSHDSVQY